MAAPFHPPSKEQGRASGRNHSSRPASTASLSIGRGDVVPSARCLCYIPVPLSREKLSVRESDRRCSPLAFCPQRISVGRAHHYRKRMYSIRRFRTKLTFRRNTLLVVYPSNCHIIILCDGPHTAPWPACLCPIFPVSASLRDITPASSGLLRVYTLED